MQPGASYGATLANGVMQPGVFMCRLFSRRSSSRLFLSCAKSHTLARTDPPALWPSDGARRSINHNTGVGYETSSATDLCSATWPKREIFLPRVLLAPEVPRIGKALSRESGDVGVAGRRVVSQVTQRVYARRVGAARDAGRDGLAVLAAVSGRFALTLSVMSGLLAARPEVVSRSPATSGHLAIPIPFRSS